MNQQITILWDKIKIEKVYTKNEAFIRLNEINPPTKSDNENIESEYNKLIDFCWIRHLMSKDL